jgi:peptide/nickel transport system ATP-binding protein
MSEHHPRPGRTDAGDQDPLVAVRDLEKYFYERDSLYDRLLGNDPVAIRAVDGVSFDVREGETLGLVGESGCGKSTTGETVLRLQTPTGGTVHFDGQDVSDLSGDDLAEFRRRAQVVFQDPFSSLDPRMTIADIVRQPLDVHDVGTPGQRRERVAELVERVGLSTDQLERYPSEFSGGQRQRVGIARALALDPDFLVLDEPTSALDVSVQAQVLNLLADLQDEFGLTYLLISHDLAVIRHVCDRVAVMYLGELVEVAPAEELFADPRHPYTDALLESVPRADVAERDRTVDPLTGDIPSPRDPPSGCRFRTRCPQVIPPDGVGLTQPQYREVMHLREQVEREAISLSQVRGDGVDSDAVGPDDVVDRLADRLLSVELPPDHRAYVDEALAAVADERFADAADHLRARYESVCERENPALGESDHPAACHLRDQRE